MTNTTVNYDGFVELPIAQWNDWMVDYLRTHPVTAEMVSELVTITSHKINAEQTKGFFDVCCAILQAASKQHNAFEEFVVPLVQNNKWDTVGQLVDVAGHLDQAVCDALVAPLWSHPSTVNHFMYLNEKVRNGRFGEAHPFLNPRVLQNPRLIRKYQLLPMCLNMSLNQGYFDKYGAEGIQNLQKFGLIGEHTHTNILDHVLCLDTPEFFTVLHNVVAVDFTHIEHHSKTYLNNDTKAVEFYKTFVELSDDPRTKQWVFKDMMFRLTDRAPFEDHNFDRFLRTLATQVQWDQAYVGGLVERCSRNFMRCLHVLMEIVPEQHADLIHAYFIEGGFEMNEDMIAWAQKITLSQAIEPSTSSLPRCTRKM